MYIVKLIMYTDDVILFLVFVNIVFRIKVNDDMMKNNCIKYTLFA